MGLQLHNTLSRQKQAFTPADPERVTLYQCGPTVYNYAHIGNARPAVVFDLLKRLLERHYPQVVFARNITDVDDKINQAAEQAGVPIDQITGRYIEAYHNDMAALGVGKPTVEPRATEHIADIIAMIGQLVAAGHAYEAEQHVLFSVESYSGYGALSGRDLEQLLAGARVEVAPYKRHPGDFVLWKPSVAPQPGWDSPWGWGRPGWHIECSAMSEKHLGETIDIHAGGQDLVFPHHENEIAQSQCAHGGKIFARFWLHNGFVTVERRKMSKSLGNTLTVHELLKSWEGETLRYVLLGAHYRQPLDWSEATLQQASRTLDRLYTNLRDAETVLGTLPAPAEPPGEVLEALEDDLNTPRALALLNQMGRELGRSENPEAVSQAAASLLGAGELLGFLQQRPADWLSRHDHSLDLDAAAIDQLVAERDQARADRDFARADEIRDQLTALGVVLEDSPEGTRWKAGDGT